MFCGQPSNLVLREYVPPEVGDRIPAPASSLPPPAAPVTSTTPARITQITRRGTSFDKQVDPPRPSCVWSSIYLVWSDLDSAARPFLPRPSYKEIWPRLPNISVHDEETAIDSS